MLSDSGLQKAAQVILICPWQTTALGEGMVFANDAFSSLSFASLIIINVLTFSLVQWGLHDLGCLSTAVP